VVWTALIINLKLYRSEAISELYNKCKEQQQHIMPSTNKTATSLINITIRNTGFHRRHHLIPTTTFHRHPHHRQIHRHKPQIPPPPPSSATMANTTTAGGGDSFPNVAPGLNQKFQDQPLSAHPAEWDALWRNQTTPWDQGESSIALHDALAQHPELFPASPSSSSSPEPSSSRKPRALIPGCGRGYDVLLLASLGYDAYGLDVSTTAIAEAQNYAAANPPTGENAGTATFLAGDFWSADWLASTNPPVDTTTPLSQRYAFDLIFDFTFLCALPPSARGDWAKRLGELLKPGSGRLVCLEFPLGKPEGTGGPPFGLTEGIYVDLLTGQGVKRLGRWKPERTHERSVGKDCVSVWGKGE
jgi:hypothetical protein